jgi:hypothetical protein
MVRLLALAVAVAFAGMVALGSERERAGAQSCTRNVNPSNVSSAFSNARDGDVICLAAGVYRGRLALWAKTGVTIRGEGRSTVIAGGSVDGLVVLHGRDIVVESVQFYMGSPANGYVRDSRNVVFRNVHVGGGRIGIHYDQRSSGAVIDSYLYALRDDAILLRDGSTVTVERNWIFRNGGVGVSVVGNAGTTTIRRNIISDHAGPGIFVGEPPCALLPPASAVVPACFLTNPDRYVVETRLIIDTNVIQKSGSTGIVLFPGTSAAMSGNRIWRNALTGLFVWGASVQSDRDEYLLNEEHAIEVRSYPDPWQPASIQFRSKARINNNDILYSMVLPETGTLGGGIVALASDVDVLNSRVLLNRGIGLSYLDGAAGRVSNSVIANNRGSALCIFRTSASGITVTGTRISHNLDDRHGVCRAEY